MRRGPGRHRLHDAWWTLILFAVIGVAVLVTAVSFTGSLRSTVPVTLAADRSGLVMDSGAKVMMRGVQVGRVAQIGRIEWAQNGASLRLEIDPDQIRYIPANVEAQISATTAFGAKFVDLVMPQNPSRARLSAGAVLHSKNVSTEINTVFENVVDLLNMIDPLKLNAVLTAVADAVRGQGERIGQATTDLNEVLEALNARGDTIGGNWRSLKNFTDTYDAAAQDILTILNAASTTSATVVNHSTQLDALLLNAIGLSNAGTNLLGSSRDNLVGAADILAPTTSLLFKSGQGPTIGSLLAQSAAVTNTLADRDRLIGQVITNLNVVLGSLGAHTDRLDQAVTSLSALIHRLAQRKTDISNAVAYTNAAAGSVADLLSQARAPLAKVVRETDRVAGIAAADHDYLDNLLNTLPDKYQALVRQGMYGDFFAFYLCDVVLKVNGKGGQPVYIKLAGQDSGRCAPK